MSIITTLYSDLGSPSVISGLLTCVSAAFVFIFKHIYREFNCMMNDVRVLKSSVAEDRARTHELTMLTNQKIRSLEKMIDRTIPIVRLD